MIPIDKKKILGLLSIWVIFGIISILHLMSLSSRDPTWLIVGNVIKVISPNIYTNFKRRQQEVRQKWFEDVAQDNTVPLHAASGWGYMSEEEYNAMVDYVLQELPIKSGESVYELGCGVGAVLRRVRHIYGKNISVGGSDLLAPAITKIKQVFPNEAEHFHVFSMTKRNDLIPNNSQDHVISFGALAMYLYREEMEKALKEAIRIAKPEGHLCFTHFIEPSGKLKGSILEPIEKSYWLHISKQYFLENLIVKQMIHQKDRYYVCFSKTTKPIHQT